MKKGWQKRFWKAGWSWKRDFKIDFDEFMIQSAVWWGMGVILIAILDHFLYRDFASTYNFWYFILLFVAGLIGAATGYWIRNRKKK